MRPGLSRGAGLARTRQGPGPVEDDVVARLPADIDDKGNFTDGEIILTPECLVRTVQGEVVSRMNLDESKNFQAQLLVGNGRLEAEVNGETVVIARYSTRFQPGYGRLAKYLNDLQSGKDVVYGEEDDKNVCPRCGRVFPGDTRVCPACINKLELAGRLWQVARPYLFSLVMVTVIFWGITGLRLVLPQLNRILIDDVLKPGRRDPGLLALLVGLIGASQLLSGLLGILRGRLMVRLGSGLARDLRSMVYAKVQSLSLRFIGEKKTGDLMNRVTGDTNTLQRFIEMHLTDLVNETLIFIGIGIILSASNWRLALLILLPAPFVVMYCSRIRQRIHRMYHRQFRAWDKANSLLQDILSGIRVVKAFGQEKREAQRFVDCNRKLADITAYNEKTWNTLFPSLGFVMGVGNFLVLYYGGHLVLGQEMKLGELVQFSAYAGMIYGPLRYMSFIPRWFTEALTAAERVFEVIDEEPDVSDRPGAVSHRVVGEVKLENVTFGYEKHDPVLKNINLTVEPGEMIGLVGHSGAGKSTLINLICRFYDVDEGRILIDGIDIRDIRQRDLRSQIGVVLQETFLFSGSIMENIAYARPDATPDEIIRAAKIANAHDFIVKFPNGYDTLVGERGHRLSGGERQRIAIARALLRDPRILILDEATASVDTETEQKIQEALGRLVKQRTTFAIAHRLSTLRNANRLLVLQDGEQVELGTHDELMRARGVYFNLVMTQRRMSRVKAVNG